MSATSEAWWRNRWLWLGAAGLLLPCLGWLGLWWWSEARLAAVIVEAGPLPTAAEIWPAIPPEQDGTADLTEAFQRITDPNQPFDWNQSEWTQASAVTALFESAFPEEPDDGSPVKSLWTWDEADWKAAAQTIAAYEPALTALERAIARGRFSDRGDALVPDWLRSGSWYQPMRALAKLLYLRARIAIRDGRWEAAERDLYGLSQAAGMTVKNDRWRWGIHIGSWIQDYASLGLRHLEAAVPRTRPISLDGWWVPDDMTLRTLITEWRWNSGRLWADRAFRYVDRGEGEIGDVACGWWWQRLGGDSLVVVPFRHVAGAVQFVADEAYPHAIGIPLRRSDEALVIEWLGRERQALAQGQYDQMPQVPVVGTIGQIPNHVLWNVLESCIQRFLIRQGMTEALARIHQLRAISDRGPDPADLALPEHVRWDPTTGVLWSDAPAIIRQGHRLRESYRWIPGTAPAPPPPPP